MATKAKHTKPMTNGNKPEEAASIDLYSFTWDEAELLEELSGMTMTELTSKMAGEAPGAKEIKARATELAGTDRPTAKHRREALAQLTAEAGEDWDPPLRVLKTLAYIVNRRTDPELTWEQFGSSSLMESMPNFEAEPLDPTDAKS